MEKSPGHEALRKGRVSLPNHIYLVTTVTADRNPHFLDIESARTASRLIMDSRTWGDAQPLCWVLMPDHWHGLIELGQHDSLSTVINRFKSLVSKRLSLKAGSCWTRGFHDHALRRQEDLHATSRYILANPIRANLVKNVNDYPYWNSIGL
jgi:putative transposase